MLEAVGRRELKELVAEASRALARLDAERLEELAHSCRLLSESPQRLGGLGDQELAQQALAATAEMAVFGHVLAATRANLDVMNRLREVGMGRHEYGERAGKITSAPHPQEDHRGDD